MDFDLQSAQALANAARHQQIQQAPTNRYELEGWLIYAIGLPMAAIYENPGPIFRGEQAKNRFEGLWKNDQAFNYAVRTAVHGVMVLLEDMDKKIGRRTP